MIMASTLVGSLHQLHPHPHPWGADVPKSQGHGLVECDLRQCGGNDRCDSVPW